MSIFELKPNKLLASRPVAPCARAGDGLNGKIFDFSALPRPEASNRAAYGSGQPSFQPADRTEKSRLTKVYEAELELMADVRAYFDVAFQVCPFLFAKIIPKPPDLFSRICRESSTTFR